MIHTEGVHQHDFTQAARPTAGATELGLRAALAFALVAHRLAGFYDHGAWLSRGQISELCSLWTLRTRLAMTSEQRREVFEASEDIARQIKDTLSREAGAYTAHELMEALDTRYTSEVGEAIMQQCVLKLQEGGE